MEQDRRLRLPEYILMRADKMTMANSLEMRVPFLDNRVVDFASRLPVNFKLNGLKDKYILRSAYRNLLPRRVVRRPKVAFSAPLDKWSDSLVQEYLRNSELVSEGILVGHELQRLLKGDDCYKGRITEKKVSIVVLELWFRIFITRSISPPLVAPHL